MDYCDDIECQYYKQGVCLSDDRYHSADRFCITGRRKPRDDTAELMRAGNPNCHTASGKYKSNRVTLLK